MAYQKTQWVNGVTAVNSENLNKIEQGIYQNSIDIENIDVTTQVTHGIKSHNADATSHDDIRRSIPDISGKSDVTYVDEKDEEIKNIIGDTTTLATTDKASTVAAINELDSEISILSTDRGYLNTKRITDISQIGRNGKYYSTSLTGLLSGVWILDITQYATSSDWAGIGKKFGKSNPNPETYSVAMGGGNLFVDKLATTDKVDILVNAKAGFTIIENNSYQINNEIHLNVYAKRTDDSAFPQANSILSIPKTAHATALSSSIYSTPNGYSGIIAKCANCNTFTTSTDTAVYAYVDATNAKSILISGVLEI